MSSQNSPKKTQESNSSESHFQGDQANLKDEEFKPAQIANSQQESGVKESEKDTKQTEENFNYEKRKEELIKSLQISSKKMTLPIGNSNWWIVREKSNKEVYYYDNINGRTHWSLPEKLQNTYSKEVDLIKSILQNSLNSVPQNPNEQPSDLEGVNKEVEKTEEEKKEAPVEKTESQIHSSQTNIKSPQNPKYIHRSEILMSNQKNPELGKQKDNEVIPQSVFKNPFLVNKLPKSMPSTPQGGPKGLRETLKINFASETNKNELKEEIKACRDFQGYSDYNIDYHRIRTVTSTDKRIPRKVGRQIVNTEWWEIDDADSSYLYFFSAKASRTFWDLPPKVYKNYSRMPINKKLKKNIFTSFTLENDIVKSELSKNLNSNCNVNTTSEQKKQNKSLLNNRFAINGEILSKDLVLAKQIRETQWLEIYDPMTKNVYYIDFNRKQARVVEPKIHECDNVGKLDLFKKYMKTNDGYFLLPRGSCKCVSDMQKDTRKNLELRKKNPKQLNVKKAPQISNFDLASPSPDGDTAHLKSSKHPQSEELRWMNLRRSVQLSSSNNNDYMSAENNPGYTRISRNGQQICGNPNNVLRSSLSNEYKSKVANNKWGFTGGALSPISQNSLNSGKNVMSPSIGSKTPPVFERSKMRSELNYRMEAQSKKWKENCKRMESSYESLEKIHTPTQRSPRNSEYNPFNSPEIRSTQAKIMAQNIVGKNLINAGNLNENPFRTASERSLINECERTDLTEKATRELFFWRKKAENLAKMVRRMENQCALRDTNNTPSSVLMTREQLLDKVINCIRNLSRMRLLDAASDSDVRQMLKMKALNAGEGTLYAMLNMFTANGNNKNPSWLEQRPRERVSNIMSQKDSHKESEKQFVCFICSSRFTYEKEMEIHFELIHCNSKDEKRVCEKCGEIFSNKNAFMLHVQKCKRKPKSRKTFRDPPQTGLSQSNHETAKSAFKKLKIQTDNGVISKIPKSRPARNLTRRSFKMENGSFKSAKEALAAAKKEEVGSNEGMFFSKVGGNLRRVPAEATKEKELAEFEKERKEKSKESGKSLVEEPKKDRKKLKHQLNYWIGVLTKMKKEDLKTEENSEREKIGKNGVHEEVLESMKLEDEEEIKSV